MEKQGNLQPNKLFTKPKIHTQQQQQHQKPKVCKLGGIHLYNQYYKRHLCAKSSQPNQKGKKPATSSVEILKNYQEQSIIQHEIKDFLENRQKHKINIGSVFTSQIQHIIHNFKTSHHTTNIFLEEHQNKNEQLDNMSVFSFQELFQLQKNKNKVKYTRLMEKFLGQFREAVVKQIKKLKLEQMNKVNDKQNPKKQYATQTVHDHDNDVTLIKKQLQRKEAEYNALYQYKKNMINQGANMVKSLEIKCQYQQTLIKKLQNQVASKNLQLRNLQTTLKQTQDRLFNRIVDLQKMYDISQARLSLSSIQQMSPPNDLLNQNDILSNFFAKLSSKKKRYKQRAESILSVKQSLFSNLKDKDDIIDSMADIASKSVREIDVHYDHEVDEKFIDELQKISKNSVKSLHLFKILQVFKNIKYRSSMQKKSKKRKNKIASIKKSPHRNSSLLATKIDRQVFNRGSFRQELSKSRVNSRQKREKNQDFKHPLKKISKNIQTLKDQYQPKLSITRKQSLERIASTLFQTPFASPAKEKNSIFKVSIKEIPVGSTKQQQNNIESQNQLNQSRKKFKKGVSFRIESNPHLQVHSRQINICINNQSSSLTASKQSTSQKIYASPTINEKNTDGGLQNFDKRRFSKNKLMKTKLKQQIHKKIGSTQIESHALSNFGYTTNQKTILSHNATVGNFYKPLFNTQKQRSSCHTSQEKISQFDKNDQRSKPRNSFSRLEQSNVIIHPENEKQMRIAKQMAAKYPNKSQYKQKVMKLHKGCGQNCEHIKRYLEYFDKCKQHNKKQNLKLNIQNLNNHLRSPLPTLKYDK